MIDYFRDIVFQFLLLVGFAFVVLLLLAAKWPAIWKPVYRAYSAMLAAITVLFFCAAWSLSKAGMMMILPFKIVDQGAVLDRWATAVQDAQDRAEQIYEGTEIAIRETKAPGIRIARQTVAPGFVAGFLGNRREFMTVRNTVSPDLSKYVIYIGAAAYGSSLTINYFLVAQLGFFGTFVEKAPYWLSRKDPPVPMTAELDLFAKDIGLRAFTTSVYSSLVQSVEQLIQELGQNATPAGDQGGGFFNTDAEDVDES